MIGRAKLGLCGGQGQHFVSKKAGVKQIVWLPLIRQHTNPDRLGASFRRFCASFSKYKAAGRGWLSKSPPTQTGGLFGAYLNFSGATNNTDGLLRMCLLCSPAHSIVLYFHEIFLRSAPACPGLAGGQFFRRSRSPKLHLTLPPRKKPAHHSHRPHVLVGGHEKPQAATAGARPGIGAAPSRLNYAGVTLDGVQKLESPNYLLVNLTIGPDAKPGKLPLQFKGDKKGEVRVRAARPQHRR